MQIQIPKEFIKYCLVGVVNTIVGISTAYILLNPLHQTYLTSTIGAYAIGIIVSYILNKRFTFKFQGGNNFVLFSKFALSMLPCYGISYYFLGIVLAKALLHIEFIRFLAEQFFFLFGVEQVKIQDNTTVIVSMGVYLILGYSLNKYFIFKKNSATLHP